MDSVWKMSAYADPNPALILASENLTENKESSGAAASERKTAVRAESISNVSRVQCSFF